VDRKHLLSHRINALSESATLEMTRRSRELKEQGIDVINLSIGEPDFNTPVSVKAAGKLAIDNNLTHYTPVPGTVELRKAIVEKLKRDNGLDYKPSQIVVSNGAKQSIANALLCLVNPGDEVVIPAPYWVSYPEMVKLAGGSPVYIETSVEQQFKISPQQLQSVLSSKTKAFLFSSPCNPTGSVYTSEELEALVRIFADYPNVFVISDEIYEYIRFDGHHDSIAQFAGMRDQVVLINGLSKGFAMTGWRVGYMAAPQFIADACNTLQGQYTSGSSSISQAAAIEALKTDPNESGELQQMVGEFHKRRNLLYEQLMRINGIKPNMPEGAFYMFPDIGYYFGKSDGSTTINNSYDLCLYLLDKAHVALVSGDAFGADNCIRFSYATTVDQLNEAIERIVPALERLK
jgi:aspartate aminotransferase